MENKKSANSQSIAHCSSTFEPTVQTSWNSVYLSALCCHGVQRPPMLEELQSNWQNVPDTRRLRSPIALQGDTVGGKTWHQAARQTATLSVEVLPCILLCKSMLFSMQGYRPPHQAAWQARPQPNELQAAELKAHATSSAHQSTKIGRKRILCAGSSAAAQGRAADRDPADHLQRGEYCNQAEHLEQSGPRPPRLRRCGHQCRAGRRPRSPLAASAASSPSSGRRQGQPHAPTAPG